jgi:predicted CopG family antitoxin
LKELDLHGMRAAEALERFVEMHNSLLSSQFVVIHGYGSSGTGGDIRAAIRSLLRSNPQCSDFVPGEEMDGNPGHTVVYPKRRLPSVSERLSDAIRRFCEEPATLSDVLKRFVRRSSEPEITRVVRQLEGSGRLRSFFKNGKKYFARVQAG